MDLGRRRVEYRFTWVRKSLNEVLIDHNLASLGDSYVNLVYSLARSVRAGRPLGAKVKGSLLAEALRRAGLRQFLPSRMSRHALADAAEALIVYGWLSGCLGLEESVAIIWKEKDLVDGLSKLLLSVSHRTTFP